jgi:adenine-specific DNA-methyltransferase
MAEQDFIKAGYTVVDTENKENKLLNFLKENYPSVIKDNEINLNELKAIAGLPVDEKVNGYGLNFVGRNFARAKYAQKTEKELRLNTSLSKNIDTTENLVLKGDNLDSLKILKNHYNGKIKCIYIDPPYNTTNDGFVYPDKFDKEEAEVLGFQNLSESDFARMDFSFKTQKSHNGWLAFMYPRLLLARDLLKKDGVIFISIDDNEQANLKLLCDDVFGEENFRNTFITKRYDKNVNRQFIENGLSSFNVGFEYIICYSKSDEFKFNPIYKLSSTERQNFGYWKGFWNDADRKTMRYDILGFKPQTGQWKWNRERGERAVENYRIYEKQYADKMPIEDYWIKTGRKLEFVRRNENGKGKNSGVEHWIAPTNGILRNTNMTDLFASKSTPEINELFDFPKNMEVIKTLIKATECNEDIILDFFAGSGTTGHAVMQLNAEDGGNRKFILCQIDEPIDKKKPAYSFCIDNNLPPVISSITIERLKRAGERLHQDFNKKSQNFPDLFNPVNLDNPQNRGLDIGFKVFDSVEATNLKVDEKGQISISENQTDTLSRIYNMIFTVGLDEPTQVPEEVVTDCIYKIGNHYYITNSEKITRDDYSNALKNGEVFIDGWTASLNTTSQNYKQEVKIVF